MGPCPAGRTRGSVDQRHTAPSTAMLLTHFSEHVVSETVIGELPKSLRDILTKARTSWLRNQEVVDLLSRHRQYGIRVSKEPPQKPPGAHYFLS